LGDRIARIEEALALAGLLANVQPAMTSPLSMVSSSPSSQLGLPARRSPPRTVAIAISDLVESGNTRPASSEVDVHDRFDHQIISADADQDGDEPNSSSAQHAQLREYSGILGLLPSRLQCDALVTAYFEQLEWIHHPIHVPSFIDWYKAFWSSGLQTRQDLQRLALLFSILCLAVHFDLEVSQHMPTNAIVDDATFYQASQDALTASGYLANHSIAVIQTLILQGLYLNNCGQADTHHVNLALAIRMANGLGLSQIDAGRSGSKSGAAAVSPLEPEMGRRTYWSLVCQDCYTASSCNFTYNIPPSQIKTRIFADLRDDEIGAAPRSLRAAGEPTTSTYHREKIAFALTARKAVDLYNEDRLTHDIVPELERENWSHYQSLPSYLRLDHPPWQSRRPPASVSSPPSEDLLGWGPGPSDVRPWDSSRIFTRQLQWQRLFLGFTIHNRTMRLHRAYLARGYTEERYRESKNATLQAAVSLLQLLEEAKRIAFPLQWWVVLIHVFTASVALCIDLHMRAGQRSAGTSDEEAEAEGENLRLVQVAIGVLEEASRKSRAAKRAVRVVQTLLSQSQRRRDEVSAAAAAAAAADVAARAPTVPETTAAASAAGQPTAWESALEGWLSQDSAHGAPGHLFGAFDGAGLDGLPSPGYLSKELLDTINSFTSSLS
jgi:hypothetical protein